MKQIKTDILMGVHDVHPTTCPIINPLKFTGRQSTRVYEIDIDQEPSYLFVDVNELLTAMEDLETWVNDILEKFEELTDERKEELAELVEEIISFRNEYHNDKIERFEKEINSLLSDWEKEKKDYEKTEVIIDQLKKSVEDIEESLDDIDQEENEDAYSEMESHFDDYKDQLSKAEDGLNELKSSFNNDLKYDLEQIIEEFSSYLEDVRTRNSDLRANTYLLRDYIVSETKDILEIYQPDEYLIKKFGIKDVLSGCKILNIGVLHDKTAEYYGTRLNYNDHGNEYFKNLIIDLKSRSIITQEDYDGLREKLLSNLKAAEYLDKYNIEKAVALTSTYKKETLFELLREKGFTAVRYYDSPKDYLIDKDLYKIEDLMKYDNKLTNKKSIKLV